MKRLADKVALFTGGGSGIGGVIANAYAKEGARVCLTDLMEAGMDRVMTEVKKAGGEEMKFALDVGDSGAADRMVKDIVSRFGSPLVVDRVGSWDTSSARPAYGLSRFSNPT
jgi:NAD(P)-dependent dehydrogenase (short-subunit alcohol dehydrogenase family)